MAGTIEATASAQTTLAQMSRGDSQPGNPKGPGENPRTPDKGVGQATSRVERAQGADATRKSAEGTKARGDSGEKSQDEDAEERKRELQREDQQTRQHERAHKRVGGEYAGAVNYEYEKGPDGNRYAVEGSVRMDVSSVRGDSQATIDKMRQIIRAALAPAQPSAQDRSVAAEARAKMAEARAESTQTNDPKVEIKNMRSLDGATAERLDDKDRPNRYVSLRQMFDGSLIPKAGAAGHNLSV